MIVEGKYAQAKVYASSLDEDPRKQIKELMDQDFIEGSKVRIMPDVHMGIGCVIGFTADMGDKIIPNIVGVDIGCGIITVKLGQAYLDFPKIDKIIRDNIPVGFKVRNEILVDFPEMEELYCYKDLENVKRIKKSIGTLGGGNHFIEIGEDSKGDKYLLVHTGSRNLGKQIAEYYQAMAIELCSGKEELFMRREKLINQYIEQGRSSELKGAIIELEKEYQDLEPHYPKDLCFLSGKYSEDYLHDMKICQDYASLNRRTIADIILKKATGRGLDYYEHFETVHNYIDFRDNIIRKGAVAANLGEEILIPLNMKDGSILARGKGNQDWNNSAPHGAGRIFSRKQARKRGNMEEFENDMKGIYSTTINKNTLEENPRAYKPKEEIIDRLGETAEILEFIKPLYNFKA